MKKRPARTWLEVAVARTGLRNGVRALSWAYTWAVVRESAGHDPTVEEVAEWWAASLRTTYREQAAFRQAFPELADPAKLYENEASRTALAKMADFGDKMDNWKADRKASRELSIIQIGQGIASLS